MLTKNDIIKLKGIFATKEDLKKFATKDDLNNLTSKFATKDELFNSIQQSVKQLIEYINITNEQTKKELREEIVQFKDEILHEIIKLREDITVLEKSTPSN